MLVLETGGDPARESEAIGAVLDRQVDGIIFAVMRARELFVPEIPSTTRVVMLNATNKRHPVSVLPDETAGGASAVRLLAAVGHREGIALIGHNAEAEKGPRLLPPARPHDRRTATRGYGPCLRRNPPLPQRTVRQPPDSHAGDRAVIGPGPSARSCDCLRASSFERRLRVSPGGPLVIGATDQVRRSSEPAAAEVPGSGGRSAAPRAGAGTAHGLGRSCATGLQRRPCPGRAGDFTGRQGQRRGSPVDQPWDTEWCVSWPTTVALSAKSRSSTT
ncbi:hypothetical protein ACVWXU_000359 [Streptomyces sp. TE33382]